MLKRFRLAGIVRPSDVDLILPDTLLAKAHAEFNNHIWRLMVFGARLAFDQVDTVPIEKLGEPWSAENHEAYVGIPAETLRDMATEMDDTFARDYWKRHTESSRRAVRGVLDKSVVQGWTPDETAKVLQSDPTNTFNRHAAKRIVRTESTGALNGGQYHARRKMVDEGILQGEGWLATLDLDVRTNHAGAHQQRVIRRGGVWILVDRGGKQIATGRSFKLGPYRVKYPGDPSLPAEERIHCRCTTYPVIFEDDADEPQAIDGTPKGKPKPSIDVETPDRPSKKNIRVDLRQAVTAHSESAAAAEASSEITAERIATVAQRMSREEKQLEAKRAAFLRAAVGDNDVKDLIARRDKLKKARSDNWELTDQLYEEREKAGRDSIASIDQRLKDVDKSTDQLNEQIREITEKLNPENARKVLYKTAGVGKKNGIPVRYNTILDDKTLQNRAKRQAEESSEFYANMLHKDHLANTGAASGKEFAFDTRVMKSRSMFNPQGISQAQIDEFGIPGKASKGHSMVCNPDRTTAVWVHETGHAVEQLGEVHELAKGFLYKRIGKNKMRRFRDIIPNSNYDASEFGDPDDFEKLWNAVSGKAAQINSASYTGKFYSHSTEIISMGVQAMYENPVAFADTDPEFFKFILGVLDGSLLT